MSKRKYKKPTFDRLESAISHLESAMTDTDVSECRIAIQLALANLTGDGKYYPKWTLGDSGGTDDWTQEDEEAWVKNGKEFKGFGEEQ